MIHWINFLHIYQPPYQDAQIIKKVSNESYWRIVNTLLQNPKAKITLNFSGCLIEHLKNTEQDKLIDAVKGLVAKKQIELVGSAKYHPILPLLPKSEAVRQIQLNEEILKDTFGSLYQPNGFFVPEMAYSPMVGRVIKNLGFRWIILDEISYGGRLGLVDYNKKYKIKNISLLACFRNRNFSKTFPPQTVLDLTKKSNPPKFVVTATDGEIYGHHHIDHSNILSKALENPQIKTLTASEYLEALPKRSEVIVPISASWETTERDLEKKMPFALWDNPANKIHQQLWELRKVAIALIQKTKDHDSNYEWARHHLDRGLASCAWWWAADRQLDIFDFLAWNPDTIEKGIKELISSIRSLETASAQSKLRAEKIYHSLIREIWKKHWQKRDKNLASKDGSSIINNKALSLLDPNFITEFFQKKLDPKILRTKKIDYVTITTFKDKIRRTFYHVVAKYTLTFKNKRVEPIDVYCTSHSHESRKGAFDALSYIYPHGFQSGNLRSPIPLLYYKPLNAFFYIGPLGKNLYQYILERETPLGLIKEMVTLSAQWLAKLHSLPVTSAKNFNPLQNKIKTFIPGPKHLLDVIKHRHKKYPKYYRESSELFKRLVEIEENTPKRKRCIIHGDIHPENVIYNIHNNGRLYIIDYTDCCLADFTRDLANFVQQIGYMSHTNLKEARVSFLKKLFLKKYLEAAGLKKMDKQDNRLFLMYQAWTALRSAMFFLTVTTFDRPRAETLFVEAKKYLSKIKGLS